LNEDARKYTANDQLPCPKVTRTRMLYLPFWFFSIAQVYKFGATLRFDTFCFDLPCFNLPSSRKSPKSTDPVVGAATPRVLANSTSLLPFAFFAGMGLLLKK
jgi:hypothetical protein